MVESEHGTGWEPDDREEIECHHPRVMAFLFSEPTRGDYSAFFPFHDARPRFEHQTLAISSANILGGLGADSPQGVDLATGLA